ncbi:phage tail protein [Vibrio sp. 10N]|uniref:phage tail protein n=1 Tax=Vibrio sp. 10N TaxID=3058938 RepID=UPI0028147D07|nr:hypothetical protein VB10N_45840 [Vibrio sp. 10N]
MATEPYLGAMMPFGGNFAMKDWAQCRGQIMPISQNQALFAIMGTIYDGDGRVTFGLPDLRGRSPVGYGDGRGLHSRALGQKEGFEYTRLALANLPTHDHTINGSKLAGSAAVGIDFSNQPVGVNVGVDVSGTLQVSSSLGNLQTPTTTSYISATTDKSFQEPSKGTSYTDIEGLSVSATASGSLSGTAQVNAPVTFSSSASTELTGASQEFSILNPSLSVNWLIAIDGIFPSRN